ncbi:MAG: GbsR/MarR family transcriptional regulator [Bradymonadaceae bacterium]
MKGYTYRRESEPSDSPHQPFWESLVCDAVGDVIEFWGFKRNHGRVWALLYLRQEPLSAARLQEALDLSKGAVSMITRDLEQWEVVRRVRLPGDSVWHFLAEVEFIHMIRRVIREREGELVGRVSADLDDAARLARESDDVPEEVVERIARMRALAGMIEHALELFLKTANFDVQKTRDIL